MDASVVVAMAALFVFVFLKAAQQRNVAFNHYWPVIPTSVAMAHCEFFVIAWVAQGGYGMVNATLLGLSAGTGAMAAMRLHSYVFQPKESGDKED